MIYIGLIVYFLLMIVDTWLTLQCVRHPNIIEKNKAMRWLVKHPPLLWLVQIIGSSMLCLVIWTIYMQIWILGLIMICFSIFVRGRVVIKNYDIYKSITFEVKGYAKKA